MNPRPVLDWKPRHDRRSRDYGMRSIINTDVQPRPRLWRMGTVLDQGAEGACVGFAWTGCVIAAPRRPLQPVPVALGDQFALDLYARAKELDEWLGSNYSGTSVLAGAEALKEQQIIDSYRWCFGMKDIRDSILTEGPVVLGIYWYESMYDTLKGKTPEILVNGECVGGHAIVATGYHPAHPAFEGREMYRLRNSWGKSYGLNGTGWIDSRVLGDLMADDGEACVPIGRRSVLITNEKEGSL